MIIDKNFFKKTLSLNNFFVAVHKHEVLSQKKATVTVVIVAVYPAYKLEIKDKQL